MWQVEYTKRFLKELSGLPDNIQSRAEAIVFKELKSGNPFSLGFGIISQETGFLLLFWELYLNLSKKPGF